MNLYGPLRSSSSCRVAIESLTELSISIKVRFVGGEHRYLNSREFASDASELFPVVRDSSIALELHSNGVHGESAARRDNSLISIVIVRYGGNEHQII